MDMEEFLRGKLGKKENDTESKFASQGEAKEHLAKFMKTVGKRDYGVGDFIERNEYGKERYKLPKSDQVMQVIYIIEADDPRDFHYDEHDDLVDTLVVCAIRKNIIKRFWVDGSSYRKAKKRDNVIKRTFGGTL